MANLNKVMLIGNLTRDPDIKYTAKGTAVADLGLAINRTWQSEGGGKQEETTFVDVSVWGRTAENCGKYLQKGRSVMIEGRLKLDTWQDKETGKNRSKLGVVAENVQFCGGGDGKSRSGGNQQTQDTEDDIPF